MILFDPAYMLLILLPTALLTGFAQWKVRSAFSKWNDVPNEKGISGTEAAQIIMRQAGVPVGVAAVAGDLTDYYDPRDKSIHLSEGSTRRPSVAAIAVVAHEMGHAQQDKTGSALLNLRASLVPVANFGSTLAPWLILLGFILNVLALAWLGVLLFAGAVAFTVVTLPVELDASRRARGFLHDFGLVTQREEPGVNEVLNAAALTYVAAAAAALLNLLYYLALIRRQRQ
jgi:Zn-dependent membrane protease YugP